MGVLTFNVHVGKKEKDCSDYFVRQLLKVYYEVDDSDLIGRIIPSLLLIVGLITIIVGLATKILGKKLVSVKKVDK